MYDFLAEYIVARRRLVLAAVGVFFVACLFAAPHLDFNFTPQQLFEATDDSHEYREVFAERFGREDNLVLLLVEGDDLLTPEVLRPIRDLTYELRLREDIVDAQSLATMALPRPDSLSAEPLLGDLASVTGSGDFDRPLHGPEVSAEDADRLAEYATQEPLIAGRLVNSDRNTAAIAAWITPEIQEVVELREVTDELAQTVALYDFPDGVTVEVEGIPALRVVIVDHLRDEQFIFVPITAAIFFLILLFLFRRPSGVLLPLGTVLIALNATVALLVLTNSSINIINNVLPTLIFVIGISDSIHMITRHTEEVEVGKSHEESVKSMIRHTGAACLLTTGTTAVGFLSLLSANTAILMNFGWQAASGVMFAYLGTIFFLPAALLYMKPARRGGWRRPSSQGPPILERLLMGIGRRLLARPWTVVTIGLLAAGSVAIHGTQVNIDTTILEVFDEDHPTFRATTVIEDELGGVLPMEISFESTERDHFKQPDIYESVHRIQQFAAADDNVLSTESYVDYFQTARVAVTGDVEQRGDMPENLSQIEQLYLLIADAPDSEDGLANFVTGDFRNARILIRVADSGATSHLALADRLEEKLDDQFGHLDEMEIFITGDAYVASAALDSFIRDLLFSLLIAIVVIFTLMTVVFRSIKIGLISLIPNTLPLLITYGYMGLTGIDLNTTTIIIFAISLGIAVDDSIHFFARFVEERNKTTDLREAILNAYYGAGRAIMLTSILLLIGMTVLTFSSFVPTQQFGLLTAITIGSAVLADLFILPALLYLVYSRFPGDRGRPPLQSEAADGEVTSPAQ